MAFTSALCHILALELFPQTQEPKYPTSCVWLQDGSLRLYLCVLLRQNPIVTEAVCLQIGGNSFIDVYISELGMDRRIHFEHMLPAVTADFDKEHK